MTPLSRATADGRAYLDLQSKARAAGRTTEEYIQLFVLEGFLARLATSEHRNQLVLKGGVLLAALGTRRPTRDVDLAALDVDSDAAHVLTLVRDIAATTPPEDDGLVFDPDGATAEVIRNEDEYSGVRVSMAVRLATARHRFHVDVNVGDPIWPAPTTVEVPRLLDGDPLTLIGYPLHMVHAEKIITAVQRGTASTRWRDFADVWTLSRRHPITGADLREALLAVTAYRKADLAPLREVLDGYPDLAQAKWAAWRRRQKLNHLPEQFADLLEDLYAFADPALAGDVADLTWHPGTTSWA